MSRNGSGVYTLNTAGQPVVTGTTITSTAFNAAMSDIATALTQSIASDGQTTTTGIIPFASGITLAGGSTLTTYTVGTWTPTDASGASLVFSTALGSYLKIGRLVFVGGTVVYPATADASNAKIGSLPFSGSSSSGLSRQVVPTALSTGTNPFLIVTAANTTLTVETLNGTAITNATISTIQLQFSGTYMTDTA